MILKKTLKMNLADADLGQLDMEDGDKACHSFQKRFGVACHLHCLCLKFQFFCFGFLFFFLLKFHSIHYIGMSTMACLCFEL